jgi:hypothetical protein
VGEGSGVEGGNAGGTCRGEVWGVGTKGRLSDGGGAGKFCACTTVLLSEIFASRSSVCFASSKAGELGVVAQLGNIQVSKTALGIETPHPNFRGLTGIKFYFPQLHGLLLLYCHARKNQPEFKGILIF